MDAHEIVDLCKRHTLYTWSAGAKVSPIPIARAEGVYFWDAEGKRYLDWNSQIMSVHVGHSHPKIVEAIRRQAESLVYAAPSMATEIRARLSKKLAEIFPGDLDCFLFTLGGADANENAVRLARLFTGRQKVLSRYRSYHGGSSLTMSLTGDPRRWANEPGPPGILRVLDPLPYRFSFGETDEERARRSLEYLEEVIAYEGPHTIAAMIIEPVTGTNGVLPPPKGYLEGLKALLDQHGILLICDEVMTGFGRTGKLFAFEHGGIVPDLVTCAKGLTSSYLPLGLVAMSSRIREHFQENVYWGGLTFNAHPMCLAVCEANIEVILEEGLVEHAARLEGVMKEEMARLKARHPSVKEGRAIGLFGMIDFQRSADGEPLSPYGETDAALLAFSKRLKEEGLYHYARFSSLMCCPPLSITEEELREGFGMIDRALAGLDGVVGE